MKSSHFRMAEEMKRNTAAAPTRVGHSDASRGISTFPICGSRVRSTSKRETFGEARVRRPSGRAVRTVGRAALDRQALGRRCAHASTACARTLMASPSSPCSGRAFEHARARVSAGSAAAIRRQVPAGKVVPVTADQPRVAEMTIRALPLFVVRVSGEHVMKPRIVSDMPCQAKRGCRRSKLIEHLPIGVKGREMERNVWP